MRYAIIFLLFLSTHTNFYAQGILSNTQGFSFNAYGKYNTWKSNSTFLSDLDDSEPNGVGFGLRLGYGFTENIKFFISHEFSQYALNEKWNTYTINPIEIGLRYSFGASLIKFRPYLQLAVGWHPLNISPVDFIDNDGNEFSDANLKSSGYALGGTFGLQYYLTPDLNIDVGLGGNFGKFSKLYINGLKVPGNDEDVDFRILHINAGLSYSFY